VTVAERRILGIDFSGASDAGRKIWVAEGQDIEGKLSLTELRPAAELPAGGVAPAVAIAALAQHITAVQNTVAGCDFPFSIPRNLFDEPSWDAFIRAFPARFADPEAFRDWAFRKAGMRELRRRTDVLEKTPFNSYNLRIHRQTWWGIVGLLNPFLVSGAAIICPYQPMPRRLKPVVIEACPGCAMKSIGFYPPYKGRGPAHRTARAAVLHKLIDDAYLERPHRALTRRILDNPGGDALDAVIAAIIAARADLRRKLEGDDLFEGLIYGRLMP
jgi:hypothetical protein